MSVVKTFLCDCGILPESLVPPWGRVTLTDNALCRALSQDSPFRASSHCCARSLHSHRDHSEASQQGSTTLSVVVAARRWHIRAAAGKASSSWFDSGPATPGVTRRYSWRVSF